MVQRIEFEPVDVGGVLPEVLGGVTEHRAGGGNRKRQVAAAESVEGGNLKMFLEEGFRAFEFEFVGVKLGPEDLVPGLRPGVVGAELGRELVGDDAFAGVEPVKFSPELLRRSGFGDPELSGADVETGQRTAVAPRDEGGEIVVAGRVEQCVVDDRARGDDAGHLPLDDSLRQLGVLHLLGDGDFDARRHQPGEVVLQRVAAAW